ncbi:MAG: flagellin [Eubacteriales bacterium]
MNFRVTTGMMMNNYNYNLMSSTNQLNDASTKVQTGRNFSSYSEDPTGATLAWSMRRSLWRNENALQNTRTTMAKVQVAWTVAGTVVDSYGLDAKSSIVEALNDPTGTGRQVLGIELQEVADSMVNALNGQYTDKFVFSGDDGSTVPFSWCEDTGNLLYRGVNVNASPGTADYYKLKEMTGENENNFVDVGLGLSETEGANGTLVDTTAFNNAFSGIDFTGFGVDEDGDPKNLVSLVKEIGDLLASCDPDSGAYPDASVAEDASRLLDKFSAALDYSTGQYVELDVKQTFLKANETYLIDARDNMNERITDIEDVDPAEAIMEMSWQQYCYTACLQIGTQILSQSLLDYM